MRLVSACAVASAAALLASAAPAAAQELEVAANAALVSDYVFRGFSQTAEDPAVQGGVDATYGTFYAGSWFSNVDFGDDTNAEIDLYGGIRFESAGFAFDLGVVSYLYVNDEKSADYDYVEAKAAVSRAVGPVTAGAAVYFSPDFFGIDGDATYVEVSGAIAPAARWTVSAAVGKQFLDVTDDYTTWNVGAAYAFTDAVALDVRYHDTDVDTPLAEDRVVASLKFAF